ncbi:MAG: hypothetical protein ACRDKI_04070 [Solirubrobacterales bacterium]
MRANLGRNGVDVPDHVANVPDSRRNSSPRAIENAADCVSDLAELMDDQTRKQLPRGTLETTTIVYFALSPLIPILFAVAGLASMWISKLWSPREKTLATCLVVGVPVIALLLGTGLRAVGWNVAGMVFYAAGKFLPPIFAAIYLWTRVQDNPKKSDLAAARA